MFFSLSRLKDKLQRSPAALITCIYAGVGMLWILLSDRFLNLLLPAEAQATAQSFKGTFYVLVTAGLLYGLISGFTRQLRFKAEYFRLLFDKNPLPMWLVDPNTLRIRQANQAASLLYGYSPQAFQQMKLSQLEGTDSPEIASLLAQHLPGGVVRQFHQNGRELEVSLSFRWLEADLLVTAWDLTSLKQAERQLRQLNTSLEDFRRAINAASLLALIDAEGRLIEVNTPFLQLSRLNQQNLSEVNLSQLLQPTPLDWSTLRQRLQGPAAEACLREEVQLRGGWIDFVLLPYGSELNTYLLLGQDITRQKQAEIEQQQLNRTLVQQNQDLQHFNYIVSHNLRAPTANILGLLELYNTQDLADPFNPQLLDKLRDSAQTLDRTLLDLNEILQHRGCLDASREWIVLRPLVKEILNGLEYLAPHEPWQLNLDLPENAQIYSVKAYFSSILFNLMTNAIKYRHPSRQLQLSISLKQQPDSQLLCVSDNGRGIDLSRYGEKLFGFYQRFHPEIEGRGLGLYLVKTQIEMLGGQIEVASEPDKGTSFTLRLPVAPLPEQT